MITTAPSRRAVLLDEMRGFMLLNMLLYHLLYDLVFLFGVPVPWYLSRGAFLWQELICCTFIGVAGACSVFSRSNLRRGLQLIGWGMVITLVTLVAMPGQTVWFGVLHLIGLSTLLFCPLAGAARRVPPWAGIVLCAVLYLLTYGVSMGYWGIGPLWQHPLPSGLYQHSLLAPLGFPGGDFRSSDYFPLLPYFFVYAAGAFAGRIIRERKPAPFYRSHSGALAFLGRHSLGIYLVHQPVLYGLLAAGFWLFTRMGNV